MDIVIVKKLYEYAQVTAVLLWTITVGILEWILPYSWYAKSVDQDIVLITGAGSGLGRAIALEYAKLNSSLVLCDINQSGLEETKEMVEKELRVLNNGSLGGKFCSIYLVDVSDKEVVKKFAAQLMKDLNEGRSSDEPEKYVSVLVNNAGIYHGLMLKDLRDDQIERVFKINILAHFWTVRAFLPKMIEHERGHIVEIASMGGIAGLLKQVDYCATKFATVGFEESLSSELDHMGLGDKIHTTAICPFFFSSNLFTGFNTRVASLMSTEYVARESVMAMRCNHPRVMLPKCYAYSLYLLKSLLPRRSNQILTRALGFAEGIKSIKGFAASTAA